MEIRTGIDIQNTTDFKESILLGGDNMLKRIFTAKELENKDPEHLAGIFCAKEAVMKALNIKAGNWQDIEVSSDITGKPKVHITSSTDFVTQDLSISHNKDYAVAVFVAFR